MSDIVYEKIKSTDLADASKSSSKASANERLANKHSGSAWSITSGFLFPLLDIESLRVMESKKEVVKVLKSLIYPELAQVVGRKESDIKWTKDDDTRIIAKYIGDFAVIILAGKTDEWIPGDGTCAPRNAILKECKGTMSNLKKVKMYCDNIDKVELDASEVPETMNLIVATLNALSDKIEDSYKPECVSAIQRLEVILKACDLA